MRLFAFLYRLVYIVVLPIFSIARFFIDVAISWSWRPDAAPYVAKLVGILRRHETVKNMTRSSPRFWGSTGFYLAVGT